MCVRTSIGVGLFITLIAGTVAAPSAGPQSFADTQAIIQFQRAADSYAFLHRRIERQMPALEVTADAAAIERSMVAMAAAIRTARPAVREGDFFTPAIGSIFRARIAKALIEHELWEVEAPDDAPTDVKPAVYASMPWQAANATPACVLEVLPALPAELQYKFVGADLLLVDVHASLIIDILRDATMEIDKLR